MHMWLKHQTMKSSLKFRFLVSLLVSSLLASVVAQELSRTKCDEYSRKNEALPESNEYRKYMDKFVIAKTFFKEYDAVLISEEYALTSTPTSNERRFLFVAVIVNTQSIEVTSQQHQDGIYLVKLSYSVKLYHKMVCLWNREELPAGYNFFSVVHEADRRNIPLLRTYLPYTNCVTARPYFDGNRGNFCLRYENGRESETVFENPTASTLVFLKSFQNDADLNKNHYIMGVLNKQTYAVYGRKLWPNLRWIENVVWNSTFGDIRSPLRDTDCGTITVADSTKYLISNSSPTYRGEFPWQVAIFLRTPGTQEYQCGGSLLNHDTVLTAAHCVTNNAGQTHQPARYFVKLGLFNLDGTEASPQSINVFEFIPHQDYDVRHVYSDIAIIKLYNLVNYNDYIRPICLINNIRSFPQKSEGIVAGWGRNEQNEPTNEQRKGTLHIPSKKDCHIQATDEIRRVLNDLNYCAAIKNGQNVCPGDSGSGMIAAIDGRWFLRGVVSYGGVTNETCDPQIFSLFTNVTLIYDWIISKM